MTPRKSRLYQTDETFTPNGDHRIGVMVLETKTGQWTWATATSLPGGRYAIVMNRASGARRYKAVCSENLAWEYLNNWARKTRGFAPGTTGSPVFLIPACLDVLADANRIGPRSPNRP